MAKVTAKLSLENNGKRWKSHSNMLVCVYIYIFSYFDTGKKIWLIYFVYVAGPYWVGLHLSTNSCWMSEMIQIKKLLWGNPWANNQQAKIAQNRKSYNWEQLVTSPSNEPKKPPQNHSAWSWLLWVQPQDHNSWQWTKKNDKIMSSMSSNAFEVMGIAIISHHHQYSKKTLHH